MVPSDEPAAVGLWPLAAFALAALAGCAPPAEREKTALLCTAPDGRGFKAILDPAHDYATYRPLGGAAVHVLKLERTDTAYVLRDGYRVMAELDRAYGAATIRSESGTFACRRDPSPPWEDQATIAAARTSRLPTD
jgi:hypothetical protein